MPSLWYLQLEIDNYLIVRITGTLPVVMQSLVLAITGLENLSPRAHVQIELRPV